MVLKLWIIIDNWNKISPSNTQKKSRKLHGAWLLIDIFWFQTYEALRPRFPNIVAVLRAIPDVDAHDIQRLDEKIAANTAKPAKIDKSKRDLFKKITSRVSFQ